MEELNEMQQSVKDETMQNIAPEATDNTNMPEDTQAEQPTPVVESEKAAEPANDTTAPTTANEAEAASELEEEVEDSSAEADYNNLTREELIGALETLLEQEVQNIKDRVICVRNRFNMLTREMEQEQYKAFLENGGQKEDYQRAEDKLSENFRKLYNTYRERRQKYQDEIEAQKQKNLAEKQQILEDLRQLIDKDEETLKGAYEQFNTIQDRWKAVGDVPREQLNDLWQNYHFLIEQFFNKVKISKELRMLDLKRNLEQKIVLCEKAEELIVETSIVKAAKALSTLRDQWREIGPVPTEHNEEIWQRFCNAANQVDERRKEYYDQRREELEKNLLAKQALVEQATQLTQDTPQNAKQWNEVTTQLDELLNLWKTIGPVPRESNEDIWNKFKGSIDAFFAAKKEFFNQIRDEQTENYNRKIDLCLKAEAIAKREDWKKATDELLQLQAEWKAIGNVSRKVSEKVWLRFRGACDEFFARKNEFFKDIRSSEAENLTKKEEIIAKLKAFEFGESKEENLAVIKDFQRQWMEIGYVPIKEKDRLQKEFRAVIDAHFEKLKISVREAEENAYRERVSSGRINGGRVSSERQNLQDKIEKLRSDLKLWENNLGFLANSKQADLLRAEFDKKMQNARQQIALMQAKMRILNESEQAEKAEKAEKVDNAVPTAESAPEAESSDKPTEPTDSQQ